MSAKAARLVGLVFFGVVVLISTSVVLDSTPTGLWNLFANSVLPISFVTIALIDFNGRVTVPIIKDPYKEQFLLALVVVLNWLGGLVTVAREYATKYDDFVVISSTSLVYGTLFGFMLLILSSILGWIISWGLCGFLRFINSSKDPLFIR